MKISIQLARTISVACLILLPCLAAAQNTQAQIDQSIQNNVGDPAKFQRVFSDLQQAVAKHDAAAAALVNYPITINPGTSYAIRIRTLQAFIANYDKIITPFIADIIEKQKYENLFVNYQGAMFGDGQVWISGYCVDRDCKASDIRIKTIQSTPGHGK